MSRAGLVLVVMWAAGACGGDAAAPAVGTLFDAPIVGPVNQRVFYLNYVDRMPGPGVQDYACGQKTYDGHLGTDITLASFAVMDSGVPVVAAAPGTVVATHDGEFDRQKAWIAGAVWNFVAIRHADGLLSIYGHLKKNSVTVAPGQAVAAGAPLGEVGSSGFSDVPHLHFEVHDANAVVVDPWAGRCRVGASRWAAQLPYQNVFALIGSGLTDATMSLDLAKDPPAQVDTFFTNDALVTMWVELVNVVAGTPAEFRLYQPDNALAASFAFVHGTSYSLSWWWAWHLVSGYLTQPGTWRMQYLQNGAVLAERSFVLVAVPVGRSRPLIAGVSPSGMGGGGL